MFRKQLGISQKAFAESINVKNTTVSNWEKGLTRPDVDTLALICSVLGVSADEILDVRLSNSEFTEEEKQLVFHYRQRPELQHAIQVLLGIQY